MDVARQQRDAEAIQEHQERDELSLTSDEMEELQANMMQSGFRFMWKFGRLEAEAKMRRVVQATVRDGCDEVEAQVTFPKPIQPIQKNNPRPFQKQNETRIQTQIQMQTKIVRKQPPFLFFRHKTHAPPP